MTTTQDELDKIKKDAAANEAESEKREEALAELKKQREKELDMEETRLEKEREINKERLDQIEDEKHALDR